MAPSAPTPRPATMRVQNMKCQFMEKAASREAKV